MRRTDLVADQAKNVTIHIHVEEINIHIKAIFMPIPCFWFDSHDKRHSTSILLLEKYLIEYIRY